MQIDGWKYYNHAAVPTTAPHRSPNMSPIEDGSIWDIDGGTPKLARWTTDFDCGDVTNWWYVIKDSAFDIGCLNANYRYKINKGVKKFDVHVIDPQDYKESLYNVQVAAYSAYPLKYRPTVNKDEFFKSINFWNKHVVFGAFFRETNELVGYSLLTEHSQHIDLAVQKTNPLYEKYQINAALVAEVLRHFDSCIKNGTYICDGARNINHETAFQDYLETYFGFRKAYCKLHVVYMPKIKWIIKLTYPIRKLLSKMDGIGIIHSLNAVLKMEEICRDEEGI